MNNPEQPLSLHFENRASNHGAQGIFNGSVTQNFYPAPLPTDLPEKVWMVPYRRNAFFTGREALLAALHERFTTDRTTVLTQGQAINGLGGIGKTQIAVEYAYRHQSDYRFVLWANAATQDQLIAAFVSIADALQLPERILQKQDKIVSAVLRWLSTHEGWLLILDNADELEMVRPLLPTGDKGHLLLTTRDQVVGDMESFLVVEMDHREGILLLLRRARVLKPRMELEQVPLTVREKAEQIVTEMDGLPLAMDQAGAYIEENLCSLEEYLDLYRKQRSEMLKLRGNSKGSHDHSVAITLSLSIEKVKQKNPVAVELLRFCAFLHPDAIPKEIIAKGVDRLGSLLQGIVRDPLLLNEAIKALGSYSLISRNAVGQTLRMHRLVQAVLKDDMNEQTRRLWTEGVGQALNVVFPDNPDFEFATWSQCEQYLPHALVCTELIVQEQITGQEIARLFYNVGCSLQHRARFGEARSLLQHALAMEEQHLGPEHPLTGCVLTRLAHCIKDQGKYAEAEPLYRRALSIVQHQMGTDHPDTAVVLDGLGSLYKDWGKYAKAEPFYRRALAIRKQQLGVHHLSTAMNLGSLAQLFMDQGKWAKAERHLQQARTIFEQQLGSSHPFTITCLDDLAKVYSVQRKYGEAERLYQQGLAISEKTFGSNHPSVGTTQHNLAFLYWCQGKYSDAVRLFKQSLTISEQVLGPEHPDTAKGLSLMGNAYHSQLQYDQAEILYRRAFPILKQTLGLKHPDTQATLRWYVSLLQAMGRDTEATELEKQIRKSSQIGETPQVVLVVYGEDNFISSFGQNFISLFGQDELT